MKDIRINDTFPISLSFLFLIFDKTSLRPQFMVIVIIIIYEYLKTGWPIGTKTIAINRDL